MGVSAYRGLNVEEDRGLGAFLYAIRQGLVEPGSVLLVESLDRISRMVPRRAQRIVEEIIEAGVDIVTLSDGQRYTLERLDNDPTAFIISYMVALRAHEESKTKGRRVAAAWEQKRKRAAEGGGGLYSRRAPSWLQLTPAGWEPDGPKAAAVARIFALTLAGMGEHKIAETLNAEGAPVLERGARWHRSTVAKVLRNPAVIGQLVPGRIEYVDGRKRRVLEAPVSGAFPAVVSEADWQAVRAIKDGKHAAPRGRGVAPVVANMLAGLARCPICGDAMTRVYKGRAAKAGKPKLVCTRAKAGAGCQYVSVDLAAVEAALLNDGPEALQDVPAGGRGEALDGRRDRLAAEIDGTRQLASDLADALVAAPSRTGAKKLADMEADLDRLTAELAALDRERGVVDGGLIQARVGPLVRLLTAGRGAAGPDRPAINAALRVLMEAAVVDYRDSRLVLAWRQGGETVIQYAYQWPKRQAGRRTAVAAAG